MGRELRRVPLNWKHPTKTYGSNTDYQPLYNQTYEEEAQEWLNDSILWNNNGHPDLIENPTLKEEFPFWWEYSGPPPDKQFYRPIWTEDNPPVGYQVYETVTEGTPISPVFPDECQLKAWLLDQGYSEQAVDNFILDGYVPSFIINNGMVYADIESAAAFEKEK